MGALKSGWALCHVDMESTQVQDGAHLWQEETTMRRHEPLWYGHSIQTPPAPQEAQLWAKFPSVASLCFLPELSASITLRFDWGATPWKPKWVLMGLDLGFPPPKWSCLQKM